MTRAQVRPIATECNPQRRGLSVEQANAVDLLIIGKTDEETAQAVGVHRATIHRWRARDPRFVAALNSRRQAVWGEASDRLRALLPAALDVLKEELGGEHRLAAAVHVLKLGGLGALGKPVGEVDPERLLEQMVMDREGVLEVSVFKPEPAKLDAYLAELDCEDQA